MTSKKSKGVDARQYSRLVVDGAKQTPSRAMLRAVGFQDGDFGKPQIGVASTWANLTPCNVHINELAGEAIKGVDGAGVYSLALPLIFVIIGAAGFSHMRRVMRAPKNS